MTDQNRTDQPDPDATQRVPGVQQVMDRWMHPWPGPGTDPDQPADTATPKARRARLRVLLPAALIALIALASTSACNPRFKDHSDPAYAPATPITGAGLATTHEPTP